MNTPIISFCVAERAHLDAIIHLLADDELGSTPEAVGTDTRASYLAAFNSISADENNELISAVESNSVIGTLQITYAPNLTHMGAWRATIEGVRVASVFRQTGVGTQMLQWAVQRCRTRGCRLVQLTSDLSRADAIAFYSKLGFVHSHAGMKLWIET